MAIHFDHWPPLWKSIYAARLRFDALLSGPPDQIPMGDQLESHIEEQLRRDGFLHLEDQKSASDWCHETFPEYNTLENRCLAVLEEAVELMVSSQVFTPERIREIVNAVLLKCSEQKDISPLAEEAGDLQICLYALAGHQKFDVHLEVDRKMKLNRSRPLEYYQEKTRQKRKTGLRLEREQRQDAATKAAYGPGPGEDHEDGA